MSTVLINGLFPDWRATLDELDRDSLVISMIFTALSLVVALVILNMLIGLLVEVVKTAAITEKDHLDATFLAELLARHLFSYEDVNIRHTGFRLQGLSISRSRFEALMDEETFVTMLREIGVEVSYIPDYFDVLFGNDATNIFATASFEHVLKVLLNLRRATPSTVKDLIDIRRFMKAELRSLGCLLLPHVSKIHGVSNDAPDVAKTSVEYSNDAFSNDASGRFHM